MPRNRSGSPNVGKNRRRVQSPGLFARYGLAIAVVLLAALVELALVLGFAPPAASPVPMPVLPNTNEESVEVVEVAPTVTRRHLDGYVVPIPVANLWPMAVMIENHPAARPQYGLSYAKVTFESIAEGGVTRFMPLYDGTEGDFRVGPVRSARHYFVDWALGWDAMYVHAGGSPQAAALMAREHAQEANAIGSMGRFFTRDRSRSAPHNLFTDMARLNDIRRVKSLADQIPVFTPWTFADDPPPEGRGNPDHRAVVDFSSASYRVEWQYDPVGNRYLRWMAGRPHNDAANNQQIAVANVVVMRVGPVRSLGATRIDFPTVGTGSVTVLRNGMVFEGTWSKGLSRGMLRFLDANGADLPLTVGPTWIEALPTGRPFTP
jgi:hypothetical protein